jgi:methyl-accepting chemotaxis protein
VEEISSIASAIGELTVSVSIASAVQQQSTATREIARSVNDGAVHTAHALAEINSVEQTASRGVAAAGEITTWTGLSARANDLETKVATFFTRVRAACRPAARCRAPRTCRSFC